MSSHRFDPDRVARVAAFLASSPDMLPTEIARAMGLSDPSSVRRIVKALRTGAISAQPAEAPAAAAPPLGARTSGEECELVTANPCTLDDLLAACKVDLKVWRVAKHVVNKWETGARQEDGSVLRTPLFQIKAWLERIPGEDIANALRRVVEEIRANPPIETLPPLNQSTEVDDPHLLEVSLPDIHVGKLTWAPEVGESYDLKIAPTTAMQAAHNLWRKASSFPVQRVLLPLGNDYFNVNNAAGTTAGGTPQDEDGRWKRSFRIGCKLAVDLIEFFRSRAPDGVDVVIVPGNHDPERVYYMGCYLEAMYSRTGDVRIDNGEKARKYYRYGTSLLGFTHGHGEKHDKLPLIMAGEAPKDWSETSHHEWHLGHLHHKKETRYHAGQEFGPVRVRILPSLCPADEWHYSSGYVGAKRAAEAYLWSHRFGYTGHLSHSAS